ncbi:MAG: DUF4422 domain-containing protein [Actinomycetes bacterium]
MDLDNSAFIVASHLPRTLTPLPLPFHEVCVVGDDHFRQPGYEFYADGVKGLDIPNSAYSEMPAFFAISELFPDAEIVGFMHYRRLFSVLPDQISLQSNPSSKGNLASSFENRLTLANQLRDTFWLREEEVIVPKILHFSNWTLYEQFSIMHAPLMDVFLFGCETFDRKFGIGPNEQSTIDFMKQANRGFFWNSFISHRRFYDEWRTLLYSIYLEVQVMVPIIPVVEEQERWAGYLAERLFTRFVYLMIDRRRWQFIERPMVFLT